MATIGRLRVAIEANGAKLTKGLKSAQARFGKFASNVIKQGKRIAGAFALAGAAIAGGLILAINKNAERIDNLTKMAGKFDMPVEDLQQLEYVAKLSNVSIDNLGKGVQRMMKTIGDARDGLSTATKAFDQLGLSADQLAQMSPAQQFAAISKAMKDLPTQADRIKVAMDIFGRSGADLLNVFKGDIDGIIAEFDRMGITITQQQANNVAAYQDAKSRLATMFQGFSGLVTAEMAPVFTNMITKISDTIEKMGGMRSAANQFAQGIVDAMKTAMGVIEAVTQSVMFLRESMAKFELFGTALGETVAASVLNFQKTGRLELTQPDPNLSRGGDVAKDLLRIQETNARINKAFENAGKQLAEAGAKVGESVDREKNARDKNTDKVDEATNSLGSLIEATNKSADTMQQGNVSDQFKKYFELAQRDIVSGSMYAPDKLKVLEQLTSAARRNGALPQDVGAMQQMIEQIRALMGVGSPEQKEQETEILRQNEENTTGVLDTTTGIKQLMEQALEIAKKKPEQIGEISINLIADTEKIAGKIFGEPEFLYRLKEFVDRNTDNAARQQIG